MDINTRVSFHKDFLHHDEKGIVTISLLFVTFLSLLICFSVLAAPSAYAANSPPTVSGKSVSLTHDKSSTIQLSGSDPDSNHLAFSIITPPSHGSLSDITSYSFIGTSTFASVTYTPSAHYVGSDSFTVRANDGLVNSTSDGVVSISVTNNAPKATNQSIIATHDKQKSIILSGSDGDGDRLTFSLVAAPSHGSLGSITSLTGSAASVTYTPNTHYVGSDSFIFKVNDGITDSLNNGTVSISLINNAPLAKNSTVEINMNKATSFSLPSSDADFDTLTYSIVTQPSHGTLSSFNPSTGRITYTPTTNYTGPDTFTFKVNDGIIDSANNGTVTPNVVNHPPTASNQNWQVHANKPANIFLSGSDPDGSTILSFSITSQPSHGTLSSPVYVASIRSYYVVYSPDTNYVGPDSFTFKANDGFLDSNNNATVSINVYNNAPVAQNSTIEGYMNKAIELHIIGSDPDGDTLTYFITSNPSHGSLTPIQLTGLPGKFMYTPDANYTGPDTFTFKVNDGIIDSVTSGVITVNVINHAPIALNDSDFVRINRPLSILLPSKDVDDNNIFSSPHLKYYITSNPSHGSLGTIELHNLFDNPTIVYATVNYTPDTNYSGPDTFTFKVNDGFLDSVNDGIISINVGNHVPVTLNETLDIVNKPSSFQLQAFDPDADDITYSILSNPSHGTITSMNETSGVFTFAPNPGYIGPDTFTFKVNDGLADSVDANNTVTLNTVNYVPVVSDQIVNVSANNPASNLELLHAIDLNADNVTFSIVSGPSHGNLSSPINYNDYIQYNLDYPFTDAYLKNNSGSLTYTPEKGYYGQDILTYKANDGIADSENTGTIVFNVVNDAPTTNNQTVNVHSNNNNAVPDNNRTVAQNLTLTGSDKNNDSLTYSISSPPSHGAVSMIDNTRGLATYTPNFGYTGLDTFTYKANDGIADSASDGVVTLNVTNTAPVVFNQTGMPVHENRPLELQMLGFDAEDNGLLRYAIVNNPSHGTISSFNQANGTALYTPNTNYTGLDSFTYKANDGIADSASDGVVTLNVTNTAPVVFNQTSIVNGNATNAPVKLYSYDTDGDNSTIYVLSRPSHGNFTNSSSATVHIDAGGMSYGTLLYTPNTNYTGLDSFTYKANDGIADSNNVGNMTLLVNSSSISSGPGNNNRPPVAISDKATTSEDEPINIDVLANDTDPDHDPLNITEITAQPKNGTAAINTSNNTITYTPAAGFYGNDTFTYAISDGHVTDANRSNATMITANVTIAVNHVNHAPTVVNTTSASTDQDKAVDIVLKGTDIDKADKLSFSIISNPAHGTLSNTSNVINSTSARLTYTPNPSFFGNDSFTYNANDGTVNSTNTGTVNIAVNHFNRLPIANAGTNQTVDENTTGVVLEGSRSYDPDGGNISSYDWKQIAGPTVSLNSTNTKAVSFDAPSVKINTPLAFNLTVTDSNGAISKPSAVYVIVRNVNLSPVPVVNFATPGANNNTNNNNDNNNHTTIAVVDENTTNVVLDGSASYDRDGGNITSYSWRQVSGPQVDLNSTNTPAMSFTAPSVSKDTNLTFNLTIADNDGASSSGIARVLVKNVNIAPIASIGTDQPQTVNENRIDVVLDGSQSYDRDGNITSYKWEQVSGPAVLLQGANTSKATFTAPSVSADTSLAFKLTVTDNDNANSTATANVLVRNVNMYPVANAGTNQTVDENTIGVVLDGSASYDRDGSIASYSWKQIAGPTISLNDTNTKAVSFDAPSVTKDTPLAFNLTVTDNDGANSSAIVGVTVKNVNIAPIANAGPDQMVDENTANVKLDGSNSVDKDGTIASYQWKQTSGPTVTLQGANTAIPTFTAPSVSADTTLTFALAVTDNDGTTSTNEATTNVLVKNVNIAPTAIIIPANQTVNASQTVIMDGSSSNDNKDGGSIVSYQWQQILGTPVTLQGANTAKVSFTAPSANTDSTLTFGLTVTDNDGGATNSTDTTILVKRFNQPPIANAGSNQTVNAGSTVTLDGSKSTDPDGGGIAAYQWIQIAGSPTISLTGANTANPTFIAPSVNTNTTFTFKLVVNDSDGGSASTNPATVNVLVKPVLPTTSTTLTLNTISNVPWGAKLTLTGKLATNNGAKSGIGIGAKTITFSGTGAGSANNVIIPTTTNPDGTFTATGIAPNTVATGLSVQAHFAGDTVYKPADSATRTYSTIKHTVSLTVSAISASTVPWSAPTEFGATLTDVSNAAATSPIAGKIISFSGTGVIPSTLSNTSGIATGIATVKGTAPNTVKNGWTYQATFAGDTLYNAQSSIKGTYNTAKHNTALTLSVSPNSVLPLGVYGVSGALTDTSTTLPATPISQMTIKFTATSPVKINPTTTDAAGKYAVGNLVSPKSSGSYNIQANFAATSLYDAATSPISTLTVSSATASVPQAALAPTTMSNPVRSNSTLPSTSSPSLSLSSPTAQQTSSNSSSSMKAASPQQRTALSSIAQIPSNGMTNASSSLSSLQKSSPAQQPLPRQSSPQQAQSLFVYPNQVLPPSLYPYQLQGQQQQPLLPPIAVAGMSQVVDANTNVMLDGRNSYVPILQQPMQPQQQGRMIIAYQWTQIPVGLSVNLTNANTPTPSFTTPALPYDTTLEFSLRVMSNDGMISSNPAIVYVMVKHYSGSGNGIPQQQQLTQQPLSPPQQQPIVPSLPQQQQQSLPPVQQQIIPPQQQYPQPQQQPVSPILPQQQGQSLPTYPYPYPSSPSTTTVP